MVVSVHVSGIPIGIGCTGAPELVKAMETRKFGYDGDSPVINFSMLKSISG